MRKEGAGRKDTLCHNPCGSCGSLKRYRHLAGRGQQPTKLPVDWTEPQSLNQNDGWGQKFRDFLQTPRFTGKGKKGLGTDFLEVKE